MTSNKTGSLHITSLEKQADRNWRRSVFKILIAG